MALNRYLLRSTFAGALGGLLFGFDTVVISGTTHPLAQLFSLSPKQLGFTVAIALWGTVVGAISAGSIGQKIGGRAALRIMAVLYILSAIGCAFSWSWSTLLIARFIGGLGIGGSSVLGPVYIAELAPPKFRGRLVGLFQINIVVGIMLAYASNFLLASLHLGAAEWRWDLGVAAIPAALFLLMLFGIPQSARWLVTQNRIDDAREALLLVGTPDSDAELAIIIESIHVDRSASHEALFQRRYMVPVLLAFAIACFNQLSGINAILYYLNDLFTAAGFSRISGSLQSVVIGAVNLVATLIAMTLIDRFGRKVMLLGGCVGMSICLSGVAWVYSTGQHHDLLIYFLIGFIATFALSSGAVIWVYMSEIFPTRVRVKGQALGSTTLWIMNALIAQYFPLLTARSKSFPFEFFAVLMVIQFFVVLFFFPETKGLSLEQLQHKLHADPA